TLFLLALVERSAEGCMNLRSSLHQTLSGVLRQVVRGTRGWLRICTPNIARSPGDTDFRQCIVDVLHTYARGIVPGIRSSLVVHDCFVNLNAEWFWLALMEHTP